MSATAADVQRLGGAVNAWIDAAEQRQKRLAPKQLYAPEERALLLTTYARLQNALFDSGLLPASQWGEGRFLRPELQFDAVLCRQGFRKFIQQEAWRTKPHGRCLGWDDTSYIKLLVPACDLQQAWSFSFSAAPRGKMATIRQEQRKILADLNIVLDATDLGVLSNGLDLILCNQVFEHVANPINAARSLYNMLAPGGLMLWTAPFMTREHPAAPKTTSYKSDFFRYTCGGAHRLFSLVGFEVLAVRKIGNAHMVIPYLLGLGDQDLGLQLQQGLLVRPECRAEGHQANRSNCWETQEHLRQKSSWGQQHRTLMDSMYLACGLVLKKPS